MQNTHPSAIGPNTASSALPLPLAAASSAYLRLASCSNPSCSVNLTFFRSHFLHLFSLLGPLPNNTLKARLFFFENSFPQYSQSGRKRNFPMASTASQTARVHVRQTVAPHRGAFIIINPGFPAYVRRAPLTSYDEDSS